MQRAASATAVRCIRPCSVLHTPSQRAAFRASSLHRLHPIGPTQRNKHPPKQESEAGSQLPCRLLCPQNNGAEPKEALHPKSARKPAYTGHSATGNREEHPLLPRDLKTREEKLGKVKEKAVPLQPVRLNQHPIVLDEQTQLCAAHCKRTAALQQREIHGRPDGRPYSGHCGSATGHRLWHCIWRFTLTGHSHSHHRRLHRERSGRQQGADRRSHRCLHRHHLRHCQRPQSGSVGPDDSHHAGRRVPHPAGRIPLGHHHQVYPLPHRGGFHQRYSRHHLHHTDKGSAGTEH